MTKKMFIFVSVFLLAFLLSATLLWKRDSHEEPTNVVQEKSTPRETRRSQDGLLHWDSEASPNGLYRGDSYTGDYVDALNYYQLFITDMESSKKRKIYSGNFRTSGWEWIDDNRIKITYNCGTGCQAIKIMGINEHSSLADAEDGEISEENGWNVEFSKSF